MQPTLKLSLHPKQMEVIKDPHRFKIVVAGRQFGKSTLAVAFTLLEGLRTHAEDGRSLMGASIFYVAPTHDQVTRSVLSKYVALGQPVIERINYQKGLVYLINGRRIDLVGSDRPDPLRGPSLSAVVLDEYADMKSMVWEQIIRPALTAYRGKALFIGTPKGFNHFAKLWEYAEHDPEFARWTFRSADNPFLPLDELERARQQSSEAVWQQEYEARFIAGGFNEFRPEWLQTSPEEPKDGVWLIAVDPGGFSNPRAPIALRTDTGDNTAIAVVKVHAGGWWVREIQAGRWPVAETCDRILRLAYELRPRAIGIERDRLLGAIYPGLLDAQRRYGIFPYIVPLSHRGVEKKARIRWALQGRFEHGQITLKPGPWLRDFEAEYMCFPEARANDDRLDALAYVSQLAEKVTAVRAAQITTHYRWEPLDREVGL